jgi:hypothetical protein
MGWRIIKCNPMPWVAIGIKDFLLQVSSRLDDVSSSLPNWYGFIVSVLMQQGPYICMGLKHEWEMHYPIYRWAGISPHAVECQDCHCNQKQLQNWCNRVHMYTNIHIYAHKLVHLGLKDEWKIHISMHGLAYNRTQSSVLTCTLIVMTWGLCMWDINTKETQLFRLVSFSVIIRVSFRLYSSGLAHGF